MLLGNWGEIDPAAARMWLEKDHARQTEDAVHAFLSGWAETDRAAAVDYATANAARGEFKQGISHLLRRLLRHSPDDARTMVLRLPPTLAQEVLGHTLHQRPKPEVAAWLVSLPVELWSKQVGQLISPWIRDDADEAVGWLNSLRRDERDAAIASACETDAEAESAERLLALGMTISDAKLRDQALGKLVRNFGKTRDEAVAVLSRLAISHEQKSYLRKLVPPDDDDN